jgi:tetratricopeptide (TPR) repeat protein
VPKESVVFGIAGVFFGVLVGWMIGTQQAGNRPDPAAAAASAAAPPAGSTQPQTAARFDEARAAALRAAAEKDKSDPASRVELANLYFDAERFAEAATWYQDALRVAPRHVEASTDLGIAYYYMNQPDRALAQFDRSLAVDPKHAKTLLNIGIVRAFGKQDLEGAAKVWQQVLDAAPNSEEARMAQQALQGLRSAHPAGSSGQTPAAAPRSK